MKNRNERVRIYHPKLDRTITVRRSQVPFMSDAGWVEAIEPPQPEPADTKGEEAAEPSRRARPTVKKEND